MKYRWMQSSKAAALAGLVLAVPAMALGDWYMAIMATLPAATYCLVLSLAEWFRQGKTRRWMRFD